ncbi:MAG TPA: thioesterase family protein [Steroidobacter sp.]|uniref:acyl-CoA thioesterase n=1 Tax=Steroidobacter sp. TaxID=1978227 RepID=UPI002EDB5BC0
MSAQALPSAAPIEVWRGCANAWECDHIGHLNTRHYVARVEQALAGLARHLGLGNVNDSAGTHQLLVKGQHMRFLREARAGAALHATAQVLDWRHDEADVLFLLHHSNLGQMAATFRLTIAYVERSSGRPEPWPERATLAAGALLCEAPKEAKPRSISLDNVDVSASLERARQLGMRMTGIGTVMPDACDAHGNWRLSAFMGRVADSIPHLRNGEWRDVLARTMPGGPLRVGSALIEFQTVHLRWPKVGDGCEVRSALAGCTDRVTHSSHWLLDPESGAPWAVVRTVGIALDLDARRSISLTAEAQAAYRAASVADLVL